MPRATWTSANWRRLGVERDVKCGVGAGRLAQQFQIGDDGVERRLPRSCDWKSTAILVQMTSRPTAGRVPRFGQVCGDNMSEAVRSGWRGSLGAIAMRLRRSQER